jgi:hypothetical protein
VTNQVSLLCNRSGLCDSSGNAWNPEYFYNMSVLFLVFDYDRFSCNDVVGEVCVNMNEFDVGSSMEVWGEITKIKKVLLLMFMCSCHCSRIKSIWSMCHKHHS